MKIGKKNRYLSIAGAYTILSLIFLYVPVLFLPLFSFNDAIYVAFPLQDFTLKWYEEMMESEPLLTALQNSIKIGVVVAIAATIFGTLAAKAFTRYRIPLNRTLKGFIAIPLVIPLIILGISLLIVFSQADVPLSLMTIGIGHVVICVPISMLVMMSRLEGFDKGLEEAAQDLGETPWMTFWRVTFPLALPGIVASLLLCFTISFDEFILAFFLTGDDATLPIYIWSQLRFPTKLPSVLALGSCILLISIVVVVLAEWVRRIGLQPSHSGKP
ncbi:MAG: ABC transporter permease [Rhodospirillales bacterium]